MAKTLHYDFASDKSLVAIAGPTLNFTRTSEATYFDSAGVLQTAASGAARFDHLPVSPFTSLGILIEESRTNLFLNSLAPVTQVITLAAVTYTLTVTGTGTVTVTGTGSGSATDGSPLTFTATAGAATFTISGGTPDRVQVEAGPFGTSHIPTLGTSVTRNADEARSSDVSWFNQSGPGTLYTRGIIPFLKTSGDQYLVSLSTNSTSGRWRNYYGSSTNLRGDVSSAAGNDGSSVVVGAASEGVEFQLVSGLETNDLRVYEGGLAGNRDTLVDTISITIFELGMAFNQSNFLNGHLAELRYYDERLDDDGLEDMSNGIFPPESHHNYIAITRRTASQMRPKQRMSKPKPNLRDL